MTPTIHKWKPGAKIVCLDDHFPPEAVPCFASLPKAGHTYTLTRLGRGNHWKTRAPTFNVQIAECPAIPTARYRAPSFLLDRFRLLQDHLALLTHQHHQHQSTRRPATPRASFPIPNPQSEFRIPNSEFRIPKS